MVRAMASNEKTLLYLKEIEEAAGFLAEVFTRVPNHVGGRILEGKLNLMRRKYDDETTTLENWEHRR